MLLAVCALTVACEKVPLTAPTESTVTVVTSSTSVPINGSIEVIASVLESSGTAVHNGTMVTFTGSFGRFEPSQAATSGGRAIVRFIGTSSGTTKISAISGGASGESGDIRVGGAAAERIAIRAEPTAIPQTGGTVAIIATVLDASGNALPNTLGSFTVDQGTLSPNSTTTDTNGDARVQLTTNRTSKVTASVAGKTADVTVTALNAPTVSITTCTANQAVGVPVNCTITPTVATGGVPIQNVSVDWGDNSGEQPLGSVSGATLASHTYTSPGTFIMRAFATDLNSQRGQASITFNVLRNPPTITLTASATTVTAGASMTFTITPAANPPQPITNVTIDFGDGTSRNLGVISSATTIAKSYAIEGTYTVTATVTDASNQRGNATVQVVVSRAASPTVTFTQNGTISGGIGSFTVSATAATGLIIRQITVRKANDTVVYDGQGGSTFAVSGLAVNDILTATAIDSAGNPGTAQLVVK